MRRSFSAAVIHDSCLPACGTSVHASLHAQGRMHLLYASMQASAAVAFSKGRAAPAAVAKNTKAREEANARAAAAPAEPAKPKVDELALAKAAKAKARAAAKAEVEAASSDLRAVSTLCMHACSRHFARVGWLHCHFPHRQMLQLARPGQAANPSRSSCGALLNAHA